MNVAEEETYLAPECTCPFQYTLSEATDITAASSIRSFKHERHSEVLPSAPSFCKLITSFGPQDIRRIYGRRGSHFSNYQYINPLALELDI